MMSWGWKFFFSGSNDASISASKVATLNITINQGLTTARRILPIIDLKNKISEDTSLDKISLNQGNIEFKKINFNYDEEDKVVLQNINLLISGENDISSRS